MPGILTIAMGFLKFFGGENVGKLIDGTMAVIKNKTDAATIDAQTGAKLGVDYLNAVNETNRIKAEHQTERQVLFGLLLFALPCGIIWWAGMMDGIPWNFSWLGFEPHRVGSWKVAIPPGFEADFHTIVQSFFIAAPSLAGVAMLARLFRSK